MTSKKYFTVVDKLRKHRERPTARTLTAIGDPNERYPLADCVAPWCHGRKMELAFVIDRPEYKSRNYICVECGRIEKVTREGEE
jgi:hypothetical protein